MSRGLSEASSLPLPQSSRLVQAVALDIQSGQMPLSPLSIIKLIATSPSPDSVVALGAWLSSPTGTHWSDSINNHSSKGPQDLDDAIRMIFERSWPNPLMAPAIAELIRSLSHIQYWAYSIYQNLASKTELNPALANALFNILPPPTPDPQEQNVLSAISTLLQQSARHFKATPPHLPSNHPTVCRLADIFWPNVTELSSPITEVAVSILAPKGKFAPTIDLQRYDGATLISHLPEHQSAFISFALSARTGGLTPLHLLSGLAVCYADNHTERPGILRLFKNRLNSPDVLSMLSTHLCSELLEDLIPDFQATFHSGINRSTLMSSWIYTIKLFPATVVDSILSQEPLPTDIMFWTSLLVNRIENSVVPIPLPLRARLLSCCPPAHRSAFLQRSLPRRLGPPISRRPSSRISPARRYKDLARNRYAGMDSVPKGRTKRRRSRPDQINSIHVSGRRAPAHGYRATFRLSTKTPPRGELPERDLPRTLYCVSCGSSSAYRPS